MSELHCYQIELDGYERYSSSVIMAGSTAAAVMHALTIATINDNVKVSYHQPPMLNADGVKVEGTFAGGANIGPIIEFFRIPGNPPSDIVAVREWLAMVEPETVYLPGFTWEAHL